MREKLKENDNNNNNVTINNNNKNNNNNNNNNNNKFDHTNKWYMHNPASVLENDTQIPIGLWHTDRSPNLGQKIRPNNNNNNNNKKKREFAKIVHFADHRIKLKECEKKDKYLDLLGN